MGVGSGAGGGQLVMVGRGWRAGRLMSLVMVVLLVVMVLVVAAVLLLLLLLQRLVLDGIERWLFQIDL